MVYHLPLFSYLARFHPPVWSRYDDNYWSRRYRFVTAKTLRVALKNDNRKFKSPERTAKVLHRCHFYYRVVHFTPVLNFSIIIVHLAIISIISVTVTTPCKISTRIMQNILGKNVKILCYFSFSSKIPKSSCECSYESLHILCIGSCCYTF